MGSIGRVRLYALTSTSPGSCKTSAQLDIDARILAIMETVTKQYVEFIEGDYFVIGSRVLLDAIVSEFLDGRSPETIQQSFPTLKLAEIYGAIAFYLDHQAEINSYLQQRRADYESRRQTSISQDEEFHRRLREKMKEARQQQELAQR